MSQKVPDRIDWHENHERIRAAFFSHIQEHKKPPTLGQLSAAVEMERKAVSRHLKRMKPAFATSPAKLLKDEVLMGLAQAAMNTGDTAKVELYFELMFGWKRQNEASAGLDAAALAEIFKAMVRSTDPGDAPPGTDGAPLEPGEA